MLLNYNFVTKDAVITKYSYIFKHYYLLHKQESFCSECGILIDNTIAITLIKGVI